jgi:hypothetical protein
VNDDSDFYQEDESVEEALAAFHRGDRGRTLGDRRLNLREQEIVERAGEAASTSETVRWVFFNDPAQAQTTTSSTHEVTAGDLIAV